MWYRHLQPFWANLVAAQGHLQVFLLPSNFCEHLTGSLGMTLHHQPLHHTTPTALAASLPIKVHPKLMNFRPRMSCSCSFTSCHKQSRIDRRCFSHTRKNRGHVNYLPHFDSLCRALTPESVTELPSKCSSSILWLVRSKIAWRQHIISYSFGEIRTHGDIGRVEST